MKRMENGDRPSRIAFSIILLVAGIIAAVYTVVQITEEKLFSGIFLLVLFGILIFGVGMIMGVGNKLIELKEAFTNHFKNDKSISFNPGKTTLIRQTVLTVVEELKIKAILVEKKSVKQVDETLKSYENYSLLLGEVGNVDDSEKISIPKEEYEEYQKLKEGQKS